jgi:hypothetical protein
MYKRESKTLVYKIGGSGTSGQDAQDERSSRRNMRRLGRREEPKISQQLPLFGDTPGVAPNKPGQAIAAAGARRSSSEQ